MSTGNNRLRHPVSVASATSPKWMAFMRRNKKRRAKERRRKAIKSLRQYMKAPF